MKRSLSLLADLSARCARALILAPIEAYRRFVSPAIPNRCKYYPSCSAYAVEAIREVGALRGSILAAWRLVRCNPFSHGGYDPVGNRRFFRASPAPKGAQTRSNRTRERGRKIAGDVSAAERERRIRAA